MTELRRPNWENTYIWTEAVWDAAFRAMLTEITLAMAWSMFHETNAGSGIVGGFAWSNPSGITTRIARGMALVYDGAVAAPGSPWKVVILKDNTDLAHAARDATNPRIDRVSLSYTLADDTPVTLGRSGGAAEASTNTQAGSIATLVITAGTPGASPTAPALPSGNLHLYDVIVPVATALEALDQRVFAPGPSNRPYDVPMKVRGSSAENYFNVASIYAKKATFAGVADFHSDFNWDLLKDWPYFRRGLGGAGESTDYLYPMMTVNGRTWRRTVPLGPGKGGVNFNTGSLSELNIANSLNYLRFNRASAGAAIVTTSVPLPVDGGRGLLLKSGAIVAKMETAFDGTVTLLYSDIVVVHADGTTTTVGTVDLRSATGSVASYAYGGWVETLLEAGDAVYATILMNTTGNSVGEIRFFTASVELEEGHE